MKLDRFSPEDNFYVVHFNAYASLLEKTLNDIVEFIVERLESRGIDWEAGLTELEDEILGAKTA